MWPQQRFGHRKKRRHLKAMHARVGIPDRLLSDLKTSADQGSYRLTSPVAGVSPWATLSARISSGLCS